VKSLFLLVALLALPLSAAAEYVDVIQVKLNDGCTVQQYAAIKNDFNDQFGKNHGYRAEILAPLQANELVSVFWVGRTANAAAFGAAWDAWRDGLADSDSVPAKLWARFQKCTTNQSRTGWDVY
jgi:hypothetical protein